MRVIQPPTLAQLLDDPIYRTYVLRTPRLPAGCQTATPFRVWGIRTDDKWAGKLFPTYRDAFGLVKKMLALPDQYRDVVVTVRPMGFSAPEGLHMESEFSWCGHCRRPTVYRRMTSHAAMRKWSVVSDEDVLRCFYCAARQSTWTVR